MKGDEGDEKKKGEKKSGQGWPLKRDGTRNRVRGRNCKWKEREEGRGEVKTKTEIRESRGKGGFELEELSFRYTENASSGEKRASPKKREEREERV